MSRAWWCRKQTAGAMRAQGSSSLRRARPGLLRGDASEMGKQPSGQKKHVQRPRPQKEFVVRGGWRVLREGERETEASSWGL